MPYCTPNDPPIVALVMNDDGTVYDRCFTWEAGQNYALHEGLRVVAVADDGHMTASRAQGIYDDDRNAYRDCYGITD